MVAQIDIQELCILAKACIPPNSIVRLTFWKRLTNSIYYKLTDEERKQIFESVTNCDQFDKKNENCQWFFARYNQKNQYDVRKELKLFKKTVFFGAK